MTNEVTAAELESLRESVRGFLTRRSAITEVRRLMDTDEGYDPGVWSELAGQLGLQGLTIPEEYGGAGYGPVEQAVALEEMGRSLFCAPYFSSAVAATNVILHAGTDAAKQELLPGMAAGEIRAAAAFAERSWDQGLYLPETSAIAIGDSWLVTGHKTLVLDGAAARLLLVTASTRDGLSLFAVDADALGVGRSPLAVLDLTRKQADVSFTDTPARLISVDGGARPGLERAANLILTALAAEQVGASERCLEMTVDYMKVRVQFGRLIGTFQALKHRCADLAVEVQSARAIAESAADAAAQGDWEQLSTLASLAKAACSETFALASAENIQLHGGIGFTWEHDAHLYFKRACSSQYLFGAPSHYRENAATSIGL